MRPETHAYGEVLRPLCTPVQGLSIHARLRHGRRQTGAGCCGARLLVAL
jgi:hypothetical protein